MSEDLEIRYAWDVIKKRKKIIIAIAIVTLLIGVLSSFLRSDTNYKASTTLLPLTEGETIRIQHWEIRASREMAETYGALVRSRHVLEGAIKNLDVEYSYDRLRNQVSVSYFDNTELFEITVTTKHPDLSILLANEIAEKLIHTIEREYFPTEEVLIVDRAISSMPIRTNHTTNLFIATIIGLLIGVGLSFLLDYLDDTIKTARDVKKGVGLPVLGEIPIAPQRVQSFPCTAPLTESYRFLINNIQFSGLGKNYKSILVTPTNPRGDRITVAANIGIMFSKGGSSVLLVDATYTKPNLHRLFNISNEKGFLNVTSEEEVVLEEIVHETKVNNLHVMPSGRAKEKDKPAKPLSEEKFSRILEFFSERYDFIIFNTPQLINYTDVAVIASLVDATILVVNHGQVNYEEATHAKEQLERARANLIGAVINDVPTEEEENIKLNTNGKATKKA